MKPHWKTLLKDSITDPHVLLETLQLPIQLLDDLNIGHALFNLRVPHSFVARMEKGNPHDPLLLQVLPLGLEAINPPEFFEQPLHEGKYNPVPGLLHKYNGRVLLIASGSCAINCRYCFRRSFPYGDNNPGTLGWQNVLDYIAKDSSIEEVILSGGDPLTLTDTSLKNLIQGLEKIPHVNTLRIHSRIPLVLPERIDSAFCALFSNTRLHKVMVLHVNHPQELDPSIKIVLQSLRDIGFSLLNQSVLLKGINDKSEIQIALQRKLFAYGVLPYYLHLLDPVKGAAHFQVSLASAQALIQKMMVSLPGYLVPKLAQEVPGEASKTLITTQNAGSPI